MSLFNKYLTIIQEATKNRVPLYTKDYHRNTKGEDKLTIQGRVLSDENEMTFPSQYSGERPEFTQTIDPYAEYNKQKEDDIDDTKLFGKIKSKLDLKLDQMEKIYEKPSLSYLYVQYFKPTDKSIIEKLEKSILKDFKFIVKYESLLKLLKKEWSTNDNKEIAEEIIKDQINEIIKYPKMGKIDEQLKNQELDNDDIKYLKERYLEVEEQYKEFFKKK
jgi:hypothetical protein